jgi:hypothetical protein
METTDLIVKIIASAYFLSYLIWFSINFVSSLVDDNLKISLMTKARKGIYNDATYKDLFFLFLFVLSCYLK